MSYRNGNYCAFYVDESKATGNLGVNCAPDLCYYRQLTAWCAKNDNFVFNNSHDKTYSVRDDSDWETTLKPRLHERLRKSKNIVLILSKITKQSRALKEELDYGINKLGLPVIVIYPDYKNKEDIANAWDIKQQIKQLWDLVPMFKNSKSKVKVLHVPYNESLITQALKKSDFTVQYTENNPNQVGDNYYTL